MKPEDIGFTEKINQFQIEYMLSDFDIGRVIAEHKERYLVKTEKGEFEAEITGNLRFSAHSRLDFPAVGDWVALKIYDSDFSIIHKILPRQSCITRQSSGQVGEIQLIATNIDFAFLIQSIDRDFNINRLERYLTICYSSKVKPIIVLTKTDLINQQAILELTNNLKRRIKDVLVLAISNETREGYKTLESIIEKGKTYCMLGSSGVGKSTLLNNLTGKAIMKTDTISQSTNRGRHTTTHRGLFFLENGGMLIDNPGMREVGIADATSGLETTFDIIFKLSQKCKFKNCTHTTEIGCSVLEAVITGKIEKRSYENYQKMQREKMHFESTIEEKRKKDKDFGKAIKNYKKEKKKNKF